MAVYGYVGLCRAVYGYVGLCMAVHVCVWLCIAMYGCVALCTAIERNVFHILANGEPLYDAYTTYLPTLHDVHAESFADRLVDRLSVPSRCCVDGAVVPCQNFLPQREISEITGITGREK